MQAATPADQISPAPRYGNIEGNFFVARQGTRQSGGGLVSETSVVFDEITDLQGATEIIFTGFFAANQTFTGQGESGYEGDEGITVEYRVDGGAYTPLLQFRKRGTGDRLLAQDTDFDDDGDAFNLFQYFTQRSATASLPDGAGSVQFRVRFDVDEPEEYVALDNVNVRGRAPQAIPVEAEGFEAKVDERSVRFSWRTLSETNNARFVIKRQNDGGGWTETATVGTKAEGGYSFEPIRYRARVEDLPYGVHVFQLSQIDHDGSSAVVEEARVEVRLQEAYSLSAVYPNPLRGRGTVEVTVREEQEVAVELFDATGRRVQTLFEGRLPANHTRRLTLRPGSLASGVYIVRLQGAEDVRTQTVTLVR